MSDLDSIIINLKACLVSIKGGIPLNQLENDYFKLNGEQIPYKSLGFSSLEALLRSSGKFTIQSYGGVNIVQALATNKTQHLTELIKKQKSKPPKKKPFMGSRIAPRKFNISNTHNKPNNYARQGHNGLSYSRNNYSGAANKTSYNNVNSRSNQYNSNQPKLHDQNKYKHQPIINSNSDNYYHGTSQSNTDNYQGINQSKCDVYISETKVLQHNNLFNDNSKYDIKSVPTSNSTHPLNGKSNTKLEQKLPLTSSCSSLESTYSSSSAGYTPKPISINSSNKFQKESVNNIVTQIVNKNDKQEKNNDLKLSTKLSSTHNMAPAVKPSTAQSRLQKYPKKCDEPLNNKVNGKQNTFQNEEPLSVQITKLTVEDLTFPEVIDDYDYISELESYLRNLNLSEPYYECMVKKEKYDKAIKLLHICTIKVNEKNISSSFPVECSTINYAKNIAAKHALNTLKKQYGENVIYPITNDINTMASRIKEFLKLKYEETGLIGDVLERMYREEFQENLPDNWVQLLEVYSYFKFDKLVANKIIIYLNKMDNNGYTEETNGYLETAVEQQTIVPGTPLMFEDYDEKSVIVSANYGSSSVWIRFVGQSADENFIKMQAKFNDTMNTTGFSIAEQITEGEFYAVLYNSSWHRVQICSPTEEDGTVTCFMVDTGEQLNISKDQICYLEPVFMKTKTQAVECILTKLDNFGTFDSLKVLLDEMILNKTFFLVPDSIEHGYATRITLFEKNEISERINVNDMIIQRFLEKTVVKLPAFEENIVVDGTVSSVVESGHLYLQLNFDIISSLEEVLPNDECLSSELFLKNKEDIKKNRVYIIKYEADNLWSRVQILDIINDSEVKVIYIDYGNITKCEITKLADLYLFDPLMAMIPPQALKVTMYLLPPSTMTPDIANKIFQSIGSDKVLVSLIQESDVPCVQLFKTQPDSPDIQLCINMQLSQSLKK